MDNTSCLVVGFSIMASLQTRSLLFILVIALTFDRTGAVVPACFRQGVGSGRVVCEDVDLTRVTVQDMTSAFQGTSGVIEIVLRRCEVLPDLVFLTSVATAKLKSLTLDGISLRRPLTIDPFVQFIKSLEVLSFSNMRELETVDFMRIAAIRTAWQSLSTFSVRKCSLRSLNPELWRFLPRVEKLNFNHNNLSLFDFGTGGFANLVELDASYNRIRLLRNLKWERVLSLERFIMTSNKLYDAEILSKLPDSVVELRLDSNLFSEIILNRAVKSDLQTLILSNNSLQTILPSFYDSNRRNLETLELDGNGGLNISGLFSGLTKLKFLSLRFCYINQVEKLFQNLSSLEVLDLAENWLEKIPKSTFLGSPKLRYLNLRSNHLSTLDFLDAAGAPEMAVLNSLDLTDNNLSILPSFIKAPNMRLLSIRRNSLDKLSGCDYTEALIKLESFCAPALQPDSSCEYQSLIEAAQHSAPRLKVYNDERCCSDPVPTNPACCMQSGAKCNSDIINIQVTRSCPTLHCSPISLIPTNAGTVEAVVTPTPRKPFKNLEGVEWLLVLFGYILTVVLLVFMTCFMCRKVSTDKRRRRSRFEHDVGNEIRQMQNALHVSTNNRPSPIPQKIRTQRLDSEESIGSYNLGSNSIYSEVRTSEYATHNRKTERSKSDLKKSPTKLTANVYTAQVTNETASCLSTEPPSSMFAYSHAMAPGINTAHHKDNQPSHNVHRTKSVSNVVDEPAAAPSSERPLLPPISIRPVIGDKQQLHLIRERRHSMTMSPLASHPVRDPGPSISQN